MTNDEFVTKLRQYYQKRRQIEVIIKQRRDAEAALSIQYNIAGINAERSALVATELSEKKVIMEEMKVIESDLVKL